MSDRNRNAAILLGIVFVYLILGIASARTKAPWEDESWFGAATYNLMSKGILSSDLPDGTGTWRAGAKDHFYWQPPLSFVVNAAITRLFGFGLFRIRAISLGWGVAALLSTFGLVAKVSGRSRPALLAAALVAFDYFFLIDTSDGRMDPMCMALGLAAVATYMLLRERQLTLALCASQSLIVASGLTHPNGIIWFSGLAMLVLFLDLGRLELRHTGYVLIPHLLGAIGWGLFIAHNPHDFAVQFGGNIRESGSSNGSLQHPLFSPLPALKTEILERYVAPFGLAGGVPWANRMKAVVLLAYGGAMGVALGVAPLRQTKVVRMLLILIAVTLWFLTFIAGNKMYYYLIHITPLFAMLLAVVLDYMMMIRGAAKYVAMAVASVVVSLQVAGVLYRVKEDTYRHKYLPAVAAIEAESSPSDLVLGSSAFFWTLSDQRVLQDDFRLGYYSQVHPNLIVLSPFYRKLEAAADSPVRDFVRRQLEGSQKLTSNGEYDIYRPKANFKTE